MVCSQCRVYQRLQGQVLRWLDNRETEFTAHRQLNIMKVRGGLTGGHLSGQADPASRLPPMVALCRVRPVCRGNAMPWKRCPQCRGGMTVMGQCAQCGWQDNVLLRAAEAGLIPPLDWLPEEMPVKPEDMEQPHDRVVTSEDKPPALKRILGYGNDSRQNGPFVPQCLSRQGLTRNDSASR